jgi:hypothetical protein
VLRHQARQSSSSEYCSTVEAGLQRCATTYGAVATTASTRAIVVQPAVTAYPQTASVRIPDRSDHLTTWRATWRAGLPSAMPALR